MSLVRIVQIRNGPRYLCTRLTFLTANGRTSSSGTSYYVFVSIFRAPSILLSSHSSLSLVKNASEVSPGRSSHFKTTDTETIPT